MQKEANLMVKKIAVYGSYEAKVRVKQRYWKMRKDGIKQRYWKKTKRTKTIEQSGRYEFYGKGRELYKATIKAHQFMPKGFVHVSAKKFLENPEKYGLEGEWIEKEIEY
jgi:hypothetical protein